MASHAPDFGRASALPLSAVLASIPSYPCPLIERLVCRLIEHLDEQDGDPDLEADDAEDSFAFSYLARRAATEAGPGCPIGDPGDVSYPSRPDQTELVPHSTAHFQAHEDAEEDDPAEDEHDAELETWSTIGANWHLEGPARDGYRVARNSRFV